MTNGDDDDGISIIRNCMGSCGGQTRPLVAVVDENGPTEEEDADWEQLNEKDRDKSIPNLLKKLGNVKEKRKS